MAIAPGRYSFEIYRFVGVAASVAAGVHPRVKQVGSVIRSGGRATVECNVSDACKELNDSAVVMLQPTAFEVLIA